LVNFINILWEAFLYKSILWSYLLFVYVWGKNDCMKLLVKWTMGELWLSFVKPLNQRYNLTLLYETLKKVYFVFFYLVWKYFDTIRFLSFFWQNWTFFKVRMSKIFEELNVRKSNWFFFLFCFHSLLCFLSLLLDSILLSLSLYYLYLMFNLAATKNHVHKSR